MDEDHEHVQHVDTCPLCGSSDAVETVRVLMDDEQPLYLSAPITSRQSPGMRVIAPTIPYRFLLLIGVPTSLVMGCVGTACILFGGVRFLTDLGFVDLSYNQGLVLSYCAPLIGAVLVTAATFMFFTRQRDTAKGAVEAEERTQRRLHATWQHVSFCVRDKAFFWPDTAHFSPVSRIHAYEPIGQPR